MPRTETTQTSLFDILNRICEKRITASKKQLPPSTFTQDLLDTIKRGLPIGTIVLRRDSFSGDKIVDGYYRLAALVNVFRPQSNNPLSTIGWQKYSLSYDAKKDELCVVNPKNIQNKNHIRLSAMADTLVVMEWLDSIKNSKDFELMKNNTLHLCKVLNNTKITVTRIQCSDSEKYMLYNRLNYTRYVGYDQNDYDCNQHEQAQKASHDFEDDNHEH